MGKDPAVLFYTQDFITGTLLMSDEQRGKYILLLCFQHQKGFLTEHDMLKICTTHDDVIWAKFIKEGDHYVNKRMREEAERRKKYCENRRKNRMNKSSDNIEVSKVHMSSHMETEIETEIETKSESEVNERMRSKYPTISEINAYCKERKNNVSPERFFDFYESKGWMIGKNHMKDWKAALRTWENKDKCNSQLQSGTHPGQKIVSGKVKPY